MLVRLLIIAAVALFLVAWFRAVLGLYRRDDLSSSAKAAWAIIMLVLPFVGLAAYTLMAARPPDGRSR
jgi:Phospholipase_D-nuclease N-terminal